MMQATQNNNSIPNYCLIANSHGSVKRRRRKSVPGRRASVSSDKGQMKDEDTVPLPDVDEGNEVKQSFDGVEEGAKIIVNTYSL